MQGKLNMLFLHCYQGDSHITCIHLTEFCIHVFLVIIVLHNFKVYGCIVTGI